MAETPRVMVVDDDDAIRTLVCTFLEDRGCTPVPHHTAEDALQAFQAQRPAAVILDVFMPGGMDGLDALAIFRRVDRDVPVIVLSGHGRTATVVQAMKLGASDFISKPFDPADLEGPLASALRQRQVSCEVAQLRAQLQGESREAILGRSPRMLEVCDAIQRVAETDVPVLIRGEAGTGKELVARALYAGSPRRDRPFVKVNCAALPCELLDSELFGFERAALGGTVQHKPGKFEFANHGTLFLDEVSELPLALQGKLLQVLQDGEFSRVGGKGDVRVDVRVIAASNRDLDLAVADGRLRSDLLARLNVVGITLPPLRERSEDVPALTTFFLKKYAVQYNKPLLELSPETMQVLVAYDWPGNVRELEQLARRAVVLGTEAALRREIEQAAGAFRHPRAVPSASPALASPAVAGHHVHASALPAHATIAAPVVPVPAAPVPGPGGSIEPGQYSLKDIARHAAREAERELILRMLQHTRWNRKEAAEILGISYKALLYKIKENGLDKAS